MAITDSPLKSIGLLVGVVLVGTIFIVGTALLQNRPDQEVASPTKPYSEPASGVIFAAPTEWTVGSGADNILQIRGVRVQEIQTQRGTCSNFARISSQSMATNVTRGSDDALTLWAKQFPGLRETQLVAATGGGYALVGIDTCSQSLNRRLVTLRGQTYANDVEVRFSYGLDVDQSLSQAALDDLAKSLSAGTSDTHQTEFIQFQQVLESVR
jgi:hypothetical protein